MSTEAGSTLELVETEHIEITVQSSDDDSVFGDENESKRTVKTILNNAFDDTIIDKNGELQAKEVAVAGNAVNNVHEGVHLNNISDAGTAKSLEIKKDNKVTSDKDNTLKVNNESELHSSSSSKSIIIDEKDTVEVYFKTDDSHDEDLEPVAELNVTSAVTVQPVRGLSVKSETNNARDSKKDHTAKQRTAERNMHMHDEGGLTHHDTDLDLYPLSADEHRNCCYRCWYSETCNACIIGMIDRIPDPCLCPCLLSCYRCLQVILCCDWS